jgi:hypothetical protein
LPPSTQSRMAPQKSKLATGASGQSISRPLQHSPKVTNTVLTHCGIHCHSQSQWHPVIHRCINSLLLHQYLTQSELPSMWWLRPTGITTFQAQFMMLMGNLHTFYQESWEATPTPTQVKSHRKPSTHVLSGDYYIPHWPQKTLHVVN